MHAGHRPWLKNENVEEFPKPEYGALAGLELKVYLIDFIIFIFDHFSKYQQIYQQNEILRRIRKVIHSRLNASYSLERLPPIDSNMLHNLPGLAVIAMTDNCSVNQHCDCLFHHL